MRWPAYKRRGKWAKQQNIFPKNRAAKKIHKVKGRYLPVEKFIELFKNAETSSAFYQQILAF